MGQAARAYEISELNISYICSSFPCVLGAGSISSSSSHSREQSGFQIGGRKTHPPCLGTDRSQVCFTLCPKQLSSLPKMQSGLGHKELKAHGLTASVCVHVCVCVCMHTCGLQRTTQGSFLGYCMSLLSCFKVFLNYMYMCLCIGMCTGVQGPCGGRKWVQNPLELDM